MRQARQVAHMGEARNAYKVLSEDLKGRDHSDDLGINGKTILECILGKLGGKVWTGSIWLSK